jgi:hypothetical protein
MRKTAVLFASAVASGLVAASAFSASSSSVPSNVGGASPEQPITREVVDARYKRAQQLARSGDTQRALKEFLWCFDEGMPQVPGYAGVRFSFLLGEIARLAERDPAALAALRERRDKAAERVMASATDSDAAGAFGALNRALNDDAATLALYDKLPRDDPRRRQLAVASYKQLVAARRYADALVGRRYTSMSSMFEMHQKELLGASGSARQRKLDHDYFVETSAVDIEALAGAGDLDHARTLAQRLLAVDGSDETKSIVQKHLVRAGHPELLTAAPKS